MLTDKNDAKTRQRTEEITRRIEDFASTDVEGTACSLIMAALGVLAKKYPADLNDIDRSRIRDNYPDATDAMIAERAMSEEGTYIAIAAGLQMSRIALDYSPLSHCQTEMDKDFKLPDEVTGAASQRLVTAFAEAKSSGFSAFGSATMMILLGVVMAKNSGVPSMKLMRTLSDAMSKVFDDDGGGISAEEKEDQIIAALCQQMGISRATAKKYVENAKNMQKDPNFKQ